MSKVISIETGDLALVLKSLQDMVNNGTHESGESAGYSKLAVYLLNSHVGYDMESLTDATGQQLINKSIVDEITLDFTRTRTLSEEAADIALNFIYDMSPYLKMFNPRTVRKIVVPVEARSITRKNLMSNEQSGKAVTTVNRRIINTFGINLQLKHLQMQVDIPLQTVIDNLRNPGWDAQQMNDFATALANDILLLVTQGLEGTYSSTESFYDLNKGFVRILQLANGQETNTYGAIKITGRNGKYLTPQKVDASGCYGTNWAAANILTLLRKMWRVIPAIYRNDPQAVWLMSQADLDLYMESRTDMGTGVHGSNTVREQVLNTGIAPNFMGREIVTLPDMNSINETHEADATVYGSIIFGNRKNIDIASDKTTYMRNEQFNARGSTGPVFEYTYDLYNDVQVMLHDRFVIAFNGAKVETPYFVTEAGNATGQSGLIAQSSANTYNNAGANLTVVPYCDTLGVKIVKSPTTLGSAATLAAALQVSNAAIVPEGTPITLSADCFFRAYKDGYLLPSTEIAFDKAL